MVNIFVENEALLVAGLGHVRISTELDRNDWSIFLKCRLEVILGQICWQILDEQVGIEILCQVLLDGCRLFRVMDQFIFTLGNVLTHKKIGSVWQTGLVHGVQSLCSVIWILEADETAVL